MRLLVTGSNGFVGKRFCNYLDTHGIFFKRLARFELALDAHIAGAYVGMDELCLHNFDCVIHLAGKAHDASPKSHQSYTSYERSILDFTSNLAEAAFASGIKRFVFVSSVGVYGLHSSAEPITEEYATVPREYYAVAKLRAEERLKFLAKKYNAEYVILRPPLVYGSLAPGNLRRLVGLCKLDFWLPFGLAVKPRTMLDLDSLCKVLVVASSHPMAANKVYNVADERGLSTRDLVLAIRSSLGNSGKIFPVPIVLLKGLSRLIGRQKMYEQLFEAYHLDSSKIQSDLGWKGSPNPAAKISSLNWICRNEKK